MQAETGGITDEAEIRGEIALGFTPYSGQPNQGLKDCSSPLASGRCGPLAAKLMLPS